MLSNSGKNETKIHCGISFKIAYSVIGDCRLKLVCYMGIPVYFVGIL